jgi:hypothetical protein
MEFDDEQAAAWPSALRITPYAGNQNQNHGGLSTAYNVPPASSSHLEEEVRVEVHLYRCYKDL